jgi:hypothetical protein
MKLQDCRMAGLQEVISAFTFCNSAIRQSCHSAIPF